MMLAMNETNAIVRTPEELAPLITEKVELGDIAAEEAGIVYYRQAGGLLAEALPQIKARGGDQEAYCRSVTQTKGRPEGRGLSQCRVWIRAYNQQVEAIAYARKKGKDEAAASSRMSPSLAHLRGQPTSGRVFREWTAPVDNMAERARAEQLKRGKEQTRKQELARRLIDIGYKVLAQELHPDKMGGSKDAMSRLNEVRAALRRVFG